MPKITVKGKADLGWSPKFGNIVAGQEYEIDEADFTAVLFVREPPADPAETALEESTADEPPAAATEAAPVRSKAKSRGVEEAKS
jgi:hypothetical protein